MSENYGQEKKINACSRNALSNLGNVLVTEIFDDNVTHFGMSILLYSRKH